MLSKWMGHASLEVTAIYANALGEEQRSTLSPILGCTPAKSRALTRCVDRSELPSSRP
ncbi:MAG: hypothetical protein LJE70_18175 [Chromatiaceae bacterium]|nr:hypothetical protein [Chromatiaceae bacterium]